MPESTDHTAAAFTLGSDFPYAALAQPTDVGPYHVIEVVGEGGMGIVYKAEQRAPVRRVVALKLIKLGMDTKEVVARFESERQALAMMSHPNVARVLDAGATESGRPYFVMEFVPGEPITAYCDKNQLTVQQRLELFTQACAAVEHAHQKALIHRDLKPGNILVTLENAKPVVKVIDFGVAKATNQRLTERTVFTERGQLIGTPEYMSPEQAEMSAVDVDTRTDIYALGVVLYELLTGVLPFDPKSLRSAAFNEIQRIIREVDPPRPSTRVSTLAAGAAAEIARRRQTQVESLSRQLKSELEWIPLKAMRKDPTHRYRTVSEFAADVQNYLAQRPLAAGPESVGYRARKFVRRNKGPVAAAAAVLVVLVAGGIGTTVGFVRAERQRRDAVAARDGAEAVNQFLTKDMIGSADPAVMRGRELTVREALDNAARSIEKQFTDHPLTEASVRTSLAVSYQAVGRADAGVPHAQAAVATRRRLLGEEHPDTLKAKHVLALLYLSQSKLPEAERLYGEVLPARRRVLGPDDRLTLETEHNLAGVYHAQEKLAEAERAYRALLPRSARVMGPDDPATLTSLTALALVVREQGRLAEAEAVYRDALARLRRSAGDDHPKTLNALGHLAHALHEQGKSADARALFDEALETTRRVMGPDHAQTLNLMNALTSLLKDMGKLAEAEAMARDVAARARRAHGDVPETWYAVTNLASVLQDQGKLAEAEPLFREALAGYARTIGPDSAGVLTLTSNLASLLHAQGRLAESEGMFREALEKNRRALGADHPDTLTMVNNLALNLLAQQKAADAEPLLRPALERARATLGDEHPITLGLVNATGIVLKDMGRLDEAEPLVREAAAAFRKTLGERHASTLLATNNLAKLLQARGKREQAEPLMREVLESMRAASGDDHPNTLRTLNNLAVLLCEMKRDADAEPLLAELYRRSPAAQLPPRSVAVFMAWHGPCLVRLGRYAEAEPPLREAYERLRATGQTTTGPMRQVLGALAVVCEKTNRADESARWRAELQQITPATNPATHPLTRPATAPS